ncbi:hypothetical protein B0T17DRAFT_99143 [Bombardia bombarda]|uniref:C2H2-type domain-containing protein n=1 Tax=Bombardia bombarda TaxID=252184 RepID=A0AA40CG15_9PEZI|nr:hypothetical protein B0T17DRAFT_99143 [Bombardia bombarda]
MDDTWQDFNSPGFGGLNMEELQQESGPLYNQEGETKVDDTYWMELFYEDPTPSTVDDPFSPVTPPCSSANTDSTASPGSSVQAFLSPDSQCAYISPRCLSIFTYPIASLDFMESPSNSEPIAVIASNSIINSTTQIMGSQPTQTKTRNSTRNTQRPKTLPARAQRKISRPEKCHMCEKGFPYVADLRTHIRAKHLEEANRLSISVPRSVCKWCQKSYARSDHLLRHLQNSHGHPKTKRKGGKIV